MIDIYPLKMVIFHSYVSLPKGNEQQIWCWTSCVFQGFGVDPSCLSLLFRQLMSWWRWNFVSQLTHVLQTVWDTAGLLLGNSWSMLKWRKHPDLQHVPTVQYFSCAATANLFKNLVCKRQDRCPKLFSIGIPYPSRRHLPIFLDLYRKPGLTTVKLQVHWLALVHCEVWYQHSNFW